MLSWLGNTESIFKLCLLTFYLIFMWTGSNYPKESRFYPELLGGLTTILIIGSLFQDFMKTKRQKVKERPKELEPSSEDIVEKKMKWIKEVEKKSEEDAGYELLAKDIRKKRLWQSILIMMISLGIGYLGGFLLIVPYYFISFGILHGQRKQTLKYFIIALAFTLVVYLFFTSLMGVPLLRGIWWDWG